MSLALLLSSLTACTELPLVVEGGRTPEFVDTGETHDKELEERLGSWQETLHLSGACDDLSIFLWNESEELGLEIEVPGLMERAAGGDLRETLEIGVDNAEVKVVWAEPISINYCAPEEEPREVLQTWRAVEGTLVLQVDQSDSEFPSYSLDLWNTLFVSPEGLELLKAHLEVNGIAPID